MEKLQKCVNFILTVPVFFATSCTLKQRFSTCEMKGGREHIEKINEKTTVSILN
jgi:hypothetical protein